MWWLHDVTSVNPTLAMWCEVTSVNGPQAHVIATWGNVLMENTDTKPWHLSDVSDSCVGATIW